MLASDLADLPADLLERAISDWVVRSPYMPKAFDLVQLAKSYLPKPVVHGNGSQTDWQRKAEQANAHLHSNPEGRKDVRWIAGNDGMFLDFDRSYRAPMDRFMDRLDGYSISQGEVDEAPERWRKVAEERGYLRQMDHGQFAIRQRRSILPGL